MAASDMRPRRQALPRCARSPTNGRWLQVLPAASAGAGPPFFYLLFSAGTCVPASLVVILLTMDLTDTQQAILQLIAERIE
ncbi:MAG: hypothetical protein ABWY09_05660, partial [Stenotrophomonas maltophilia]